MKKKIIIWIFIWLASNGYAQLVIQKSSISPSGGTLNAGEQQIVFTTGEIMVQEKSVSELSLSEGFINPEIRNETGITGFDTLTGVKIYPNPVADWLNVSLPETSNYELFLYDTTGKLILQRQTSENIKFSLSNLHKGNYILISVDRKNQLYDQRVIVKK